jgi:hypothetical protein
MELNWKYGLYGLILILALIGLYLVLFRPAPDVQAGCNFDCDTTIVTTDYHDNWIASEICGSGHDICCIEKILYDIAQGYNVYCNCCDCTEGGVTTDLGTCAYGNGFFDYLGAMMGLCELGGS